MRSLLILCCCALGVMAIGVAISSTPPIREYEFSGHVFKVDYPADVDVHSANPLSNVAYIGYVGAEQVRPSWATRVTGIVPSALVEISSTSNLRDLPLSRFVRTSRSRILMGSLFTADGKKLRIWYGRERYEGPGTDFYIFATSFSEWQVTDFLTSFQPIR